MKTPALFRTFVLTVAFTNLSSMAFAASKHSANQSYHRFSNEISTARQTCANLSELSGACSTLMKEFRNCSLYVPFSKRSTCYPLALPADKCIDNKLRTFASANSSLGNVMSGLAADPVLDDSSKLDLFLAAQEAVSMCETEATQLELASSELAPYMTNGK